MMDSVNSTTFIKRPPCMTKTEKKFLDTKELLSGRIFVGCYQGRRYVAALNEYRDVVIVHSEETDLRSDIDNLRKKWRDAENIKWVGITGPDSVDLPDMYCFWVKLTNLAFGHYWFQIKHVQLKGAEISMQLKCIRKFQAIKSEFATNLIEKMTVQNENEKSDMSTVNWKLKEASKDLIKKMIITITHTCNYIAQILMPQLTWNNLWHAMKVVCGLTISIIMGIIIFLGNLGEYILKLIREISVLVYALTPIVIHLIDFCSKIVGGFYILIAGLCGKNVYRPVGQSQGQSGCCNLNASRPLPINWKKRNDMLRRELFSD